jgi:two-component system, sensor histidine kinase LadS
VRRFIRACLTAAGLGLFVALAAFAQDSPPPTAPAAAAIALPNEGASISLDGRSRYWIDPTGIRTVDQVEAAAGSMAWSLRQTGHGYNLDGKALWFEFDAVNTGSRRWFLQVGGSGIDRVQFFYRGADGQWVERQQGRFPMALAGPLPDLRVVPGAADTGSLLGPCGTCAGRFRLPHGLVRPVDSARLA